MRGISLNRESSWEHSLLEKALRDCYAQYIRERFWSWEKVRVILSTWTDKIIHGKSSTILIFALWNKNVIFVQVMPGACYLYSMVPCTLIDTIPHILGGYGWGYLATIRLNWSKVWSSVLIFTLFIFHFSVALCFLTWVLVTPTLMSELTVKTISNSPPWRLLVFPMLSLIFKQLKKKKIPFHF